MCYLRLTWESKFIWHTDFTFWAVAAIHEKLLETYLWFLAASLGVHHPPWRRNGQPPRDLCLYLTTPEEKPSKAPLSHETGQVDNVPAQERLPQTSWQSQWHCWTTVAHCMFDLWSHYMDQGDQHHLRIRLFLKLNLELKDILETFSPMATQHFQNQNTPKHSKEGFQWPSSTSNSMNTLRQLMCFVFNVTSKTHFAWHSLQFSNCIHPFLIWCYEGESTMRRAQILWKSCLHGSKHWQASKKAAWKERHLMWMQCKG